MARNATAEAQPQGAPACPVNPVVLPDVASQAHPEAPAEPKVGDNSAEAGEHKMQDVLAEINDVAKKVGGFKRLSEIAGTLAEVEQ